MRSLLLALPAKESAHGYELKQALEQTFGSACPSPNIGARLHFQADFDWLERCHEELT